MICTVMFGFDLFALGESAIELVLAFCIKLQCQNGRCTYRDLPALFGFGPDIVEPGVDLEMQGRG